MAAAKCSAGHPRVLPTLRTHAPVLHPLPTAWRHSTLPSRSDLLERGANVVAQGGWRELRERSPGSLNTLSATAGNRPLSRFQGNTWSVSSAADTEFVVDGLRRPPNLLVTQHRRGA
jgi:hypothetical protein